MTIAPHGQGGQGSTAGAAAFIRSGVTPDGDSIFGRWVLVSPARHGAGNRGRSWRMTRRGVKVVASCWAVALACSFFGCGGGNEEATVPSERLRPSGGDSRSGVAAIPATPAAVRDTLATTAKQVSAVRARTKALSVVGFMRVTRASGKNALPMTPGIIWIGDRPTASGVATVRAADSPGSVYLIVARRLQSTFDEQMLPRRMTVAALDDEGTVWCSSTDDPAPREC